MTDRLLFLLTPGETKLLWYTIRRTWGLRRYAARISLRQYGQGYKRGKLQLDHGTGMAENSCRRALAGLVKAKVVIVVKPAVGVAGLGPLLRPAWVDEIDWRYLHERNGTYDVAEPTPPDILDITPEEARKAYEKFAKDFRITEPVKVPLSPRRRKEMYDENNNYAWPNQKERRNPAAEFTLFCKKNGVDIPTMTDMRNFLTDMTGTTALVDQGTFEGDRAMSQANNTLQNLIGMGYKTRASLETLLIEWRKSRGGQLMLEKTGNPDVTPTIETYLRFASKQKTEQQKRAEQPPKQASNSSLDSGITMRDLYEDQ